MRHPVYEGMRPDKKPADVHKETVKPNGRVAAHTRTVGDLTLTNLDKLFWPEKHYTKGDLLGYYESIAPVMLPYLKDRPQSMLRHPNGYKGSHFFQKDVTFHLPKGEKTTLVSSDAGDVDYLVATSKQSLLLMAQLGCIEINPWSSRLGSLDKPDWGVIDLDPEGVQFSTVIKVARTVHDVCKELGVPAYPKTSGKTGIHIFIPMGAQYSYEQVKDFVHLLVIEVNKRQPKLTSLERMPSKRKHRVYLDYLQNNEGQTLAAPYSVRPTRDASVSTPLAWEEVKEGLKPSDFTIMNMAKRIEKVGDLWKPVLGEGIDIQAILQKMEKPAGDRVE